MPDHFYVVLPSAFGAIGIVWRATEGRPQVQQVLLPTAQASAEQHVQAAFVGARPLSHPTIAGLGECIQSFLDGEPGHFGLESIALGRCSEFQRRVLLAEHEIPRGWVSTYGRIARHLGLPGAARAVGRALAQNPFPIIIPCHRAIKAGGELGGYQGGVEMKRASLEREGVQFSAAGLRGARTVLLRGSDGPARCHRHAAVETTGTGENVSVIQATSPVSHRSWVCDSFSIQTLAKILSECRKFGLHMALAHQTLSQIGDKRLQGALENAQIKVIFGTGRQTAEAITKELFILELEEVKHEVEDENQKSRTHPTFYPLFEQWEKLIQLTQSLQRCSILVQLPEKRKVVRLNTVTVHDGGCSPSELEELKKILTQSVGKPCWEMEGEIADNLCENSGEEEVTYWEGIRLE